MGSEMCIRDRRGIVIRGADPAKVLGTNLWRSDEIEKARWGGYWIAGEALLPEVGPESDK